MTLHKIKLTCNICHKSAITTYDDHEEPFWSDEDAVRSDVLSHYLRLHENEIKQDSKNYNMSMEVVR